MKRWSMALLGLIFCANIASAQTEPPAILVWAPSLDAFVGQSKILFDQIGLAATAEKFDGLVKAKLGSKGFAGIDGARPIGVFLAFEPDPLGALVLPIAQPKDFFDLLDRLDIKSTKQADGTYILKLPVPIEVFAKVADRHALITVLNKGGFAPKYDPTRLFPQQNSLVSARLRIDLLPKDARQLAISKFEDALQQSTKRNPPADTPAQKAFTEAFQQTITRLFAQTLQEGKELSLDVLFDAKAKGLDVKLSLTPQADTPLAKSLAEAGTRASVFAVDPTGQETSALVAKVNFALPEVLAKAFAQLVAEGYLEGANNLRDADKKKQAQELLDALQPALEAGEIDAVLRLVGPGGGQKLGAVVGVKTKGSDKLGGIFRSLAEDAKKQMSDAEQAKVMLDAATVGTTKIHRFILPKDKVRLGANDVLGESTLSLAFRPDAAFAGIGWESLPALMKLTEATKPGPSRLAQFRIDVMQLSPLLATTPEALATVPKIFTQKADGLCQIDVTGGERLSINLAVRTPALRFMGMSRPDEKK